MTPFIWVKLEVFVTGETKHELSLDVCIIEKVLVKSYVSLVIDHFVNFS